MSFTWGVMAVLAPSGLAQPWRKCGGYLLVLTWILPKGYPRTGNREWLQPTGRTADVDAGPRGSGTQPAEARHLVAGRFQDWLKPDAVLSREQDAMTMLPIPDL